MLRFFMLFFFLVLLSYLLIKYFQVQNNLKKTIFCSRVSMLNLNPSVQYIAFFSFFTREGILKRESKNRPMKVANALSDCKNTLLPIPMMLWKSSGLVVVAIDFESNSLVFQISTLLHGRISLPSFRG